MRNNWNKVIVVVVLILVVVGVLLIKHRTKSEKEGDQNLVTETQISPGILSPSAPYEESQLIKKQEITKSQRTPKQVQPEEKPEQVKIDEDTLAVANNFKITEDYFEKKYQALPEPQKDIFKNNKEGLLDQLIVRELLYQEAKNREFAQELNKETDMERSKDMAIEKLIMEVVQRIEITEDEMEIFYNTGKSEMRGAGFEQVKPPIKEFLRQQKQGEVIDQYIEDLKTRAKVIKNEQWLKEQQALKPPNPLEQALKSGKPTVLDLGAGYCIPCKMMKPIFDELEREYEGKANIILLDINEHKDLASKYQVRVIPTQVFFDKNGTESWRLEGFLAKDEIMQKLKELGVE